MKTAIFYSVNAGLYLYSGGTGILIDGIHTGVDDGFSPMPQQLSQQLHTHTGLFAHVDGLLFTHLHPDHFDSDGLSTACSTLPSPWVFGPGLTNPVIQAEPIQPGLMRIQIDSGFITAMDTIHDGKIFRHDPHISFLIEINGDCLFISGDAILSEEKAVLLSCAYNGKVDAGFFNLYQLASPDGLAFLRELAPSRVFLYHLPFPEDDKFNYWAMAQQVLEHYPPDLPQPECLEHMAWLDSVAAPWTQG